MDEFVITAKNIEKEYKIYSKKSQKYLDFFLPKSFGTSFYALDDVSFNVKRGESLALIGLNGSGKTTLANILAGAAEASGGELETVGKVSMIAVNAGVDPFLTGMDNIVQKGLMLGMDHKQIQERIPEILEFADLGDFIHQQVKTYSSGMKSRLGFAISVNIDPDILIIDEALSVGDPTFTEKCLEKMNEFRTNGKTIIFVSHAISQVRMFCDTALWLEGGRVREAGNCMDVTSKYVKFVRDFNALDNATRKKYVNSIRERQRRKGDGAVAKEILRSMEGKADEGDITEANPEAYVDIPEYELVLEHKDNGGLVMRAAGERCDSVRFAWYIYKKGEKNPIIKLPYKYEQESTYIFDESGTYRVRLFMLANGEINMITSDWFDIKL